MRRIYFLKLPYKYKFIKNCYQEPSILIKIAITIHFLCSNPANQRQIPMKKKHQVKESSSSNESASYEVESIISKRIKNGRQEYKVVWKGYPVEEATWEPKSNMDNCSQLIVEFQLSLLTKKDKQEMVEAVFQSNDEVQDEVQNMPYNIFENNLNAVSSLSVIQQCKKIGIFLDKTIKKYRSLPPNCQIQEIVQAQGVFDENQPNYYLVKVKGNEGFFKIERDILLNHENGRKKIINYYQSVPSRK